MTCLVLRFKGDTYAARIMPPRRPIRMNDAIGNAYDRCAELAAPDDGDEALPGARWKIIDTDDPGWARVDPSGTWRETARDAAVAAGLL